jgi:hypothetical protein
MNTFSLIEICAIRGPETAIPQNETSRVAVEVAFVVRRETQSLLKIYERDLRQ